MFAPYSPAITVGPGCGGKKPWVTDKAEVIGMPRYRIETFNSLEMAKTIGINSFGLGNVSFVLAIGLYPVAVLICSIIAWILHVRKRRGALIVNLIPMLWILFLGVPLFLINI